jgi:hypothetical protein
MCGVFPRAMTLTTFRVIAAETSTAIDAVRISRKMTDRPTSHRKNRWKKAWTELSKEAVWLAIVPRSAYSGSRLGGIQAAPTRRTREHFKPSQLIHFAVTISNVPLQSRRGGSDCSVVASNINA